MKYFPLILLSFLIASCRETGTKTKTNNREHYYQTVVPKDTIVMLGDTFHAKIYLSNYPQRLLISITVDSISKDSIKPYIKDVVLFKLPIKDSIGYFNYLPNDEGNYFFTGRINVKEIDTIKHIENKRRYRTYWFFSKFKVKNPDSK
jgi:hypothetical protein